MVAVWRQVVGFACVALLAGCATPKTLVLLLPDEDGSTGQAGVSNTAGAVDLTAPRDATLVAEGRAPERVRTMAEADVARRFGDTLRGLPAAPHRFTVYFVFESDALTDESKQLVPEILRAVKDGSAHEVVVVGHTDTMGRPDANITLGMQRAAAVRNLLVAGGVDTKIVTVTSLGEMFPAVPTPDEMREAANRRVEVAVYPRQH